MENLPAIDPNKPFVFVSYSVSDVREEIFYAVSAERSATEMAGDALTTWQENNPDLALCEAATDEEIHAALEMAYGGANGSFFEISNGCAVFDMEGFAYFLRHIKNEDERLALAGE